MNLKKFARTSLSAVFIAGSVISSVSFAAVEKPNIVILATGGTIAGAGNSSTENKYKAGQLPIDQLIDAIPEARSIANISGEQVAQIGSQAMNDKVWLTLSKKLNELAKNEDVDGIVVTHGTDTMEETAFFADLTVATDKPIVFVGAMRSATAMSADGPKNLYNAIGIAADEESRGRGVLVTLNDEIVAARFVTKTSTTAVNAFTGREFGTLGYVYDTKPTYYLRTERRTTPENVYNITKLNKLPKVDIVYGYSNANSNMIKSLVAEKVNGIVYAGVGNGNIYPTVMSELEAAADNGINIVRSARVGSGRITLDAEIDDKEAGFIVSDYLNPQKARVLLMLALTETDKPDEIQKTFFGF